MELPLVALRALRRGDGGLVAKGGLPGDGHGGLAQRGDLRALLRRLPFLVGFFGQGGGGQEAQEHDEAQEEGDASFLHGASSFQSSGQPKTLSRLDLCAPLPVSSVLRAVKATLWPSASLNSAPSAVR